MSILMCVHKPLDYFRRAIAAFMVGVLFLGIPMFWYRFCAREPDSVSLELQGVSLVERMAVSFDNGIGGSFQPLRPVFLGPATGPGGEDSGRWLFRASLPGRTSPRTGSFSLCYREGEEKTSVIVRGIGIRSHKFFSATFRVPLEKAYVAEKASFHRQDNALELVMEGSSAILHPSLAMRYRWVPEFRFRTWTSHAKISLALILAVVMGLALLSPFQKHDRFSVRTMATLAAVALCAAFLFAFVLPLSSFLANQDTFDYSTKAIVLQLLPRMAAVFALFLMAFLAMHPVLGFLPALLVQGFLVYEYLEIGILSADFPSLAGSTDFFRNPPRQLLDLGNLALLSGGFCLAGKRIRPWLHWVSLGLMVMLGASLADVRKADNLGEGLEKDPCVQAADDVVENAFFSAKKNVLFFVLDAIDVQVANEVLQANPEWKESLSGFTAYTNNVGMYSHTSYGVPGIFSGHYSPYERMSAKYGLEAIGTNSFFRPYDAAGIPVFTVQSGLANGWSNVTNATDAVDLVSTASVSERKRDLLHRRTNAKMAWNVAEIAMFRALPFLEKADYLTALTQQWNADMGSSYHLEKALFDRLRKAEVRQDADCVLQFHHTKGGHIPFTRDREGRPWKGADTMEGYFEQSWYAMGETARFLDFLKERGLYDNSLIVLLADHGLTYEHFRDVERNTHPFLWVKPRHAEAPFVFSNAPTTHSHVHLVARESLAKDLSADEITALLSQPEGRVAYTNERRLYYDPHYYDAEGKPIPGPSK